MPVHILPASPVSTTGVAARSAKGASEKPEASFGELMAQHAAELTVKSSPETVLSSETAASKALTPGAKTTAPTAALSSSAKNTAAQPATELETEKEKSFVPLQNPIVATEAETKEESSSTDSAVDPKTRGADHESKGSSEAGRANAETTSSASSSVPAAVGNPLPVVVPEPGVPVVAAPATQLSPHAAAKSSSAGSTSLKKSSGKEQSAEKTATTLPGTDSMVQIVQQASQSASESSPVALPENTSVSVPDTDTDKLAPAASRQTVKTMATTPEPSSSLQQGIAAGKDDPAEGASIAVAEADTKPARGTADPATQKQVFSESARVNALGQGATAPMAPHATAAATVTAAIPASTGIGALASQHTSGVQDSAPLAANPYQRLDQAGSSVSPVVLHANANRVTVGIHDPSLGWVEVKTQSVAGQVSAALVASTSQTHQSLAAQLPALTQFLSDRSVTVSSVTVQQGSSGGGMSSGDGQGKQQSANQQGGGGSATETPATPVETLDVVPEGRPLSYISVRA